MKIFVAWVLISLLFPVYGAMAYRMEDCVRCHQAGSRESRLEVPVEEFTRSVHGSEMTCLDCHTGVRGADHQTVKGAGAVDCSRCHAQENLHGLKAGEDLRPGCQSCHPPHSILKKDHPSSSVYPQNLRKTCKGCHPAECGETGWLEWLPSLRVASHGKQDFGVSYDKNNCLGCHQGQAAHGEKGPLNDQDCHRCHLPPKGQPPLLGYIHPKADFKTHPGIMMAGIFYLIFLGVLLFAGVRWVLKKTSERSIGPGR